MDLSKLDTVAACDEGADLELTHPITGAVLTDEKTGEAVSIKLIGADSKEYQSLTHKAQTKRLNKRLSRGGVVKMTAEELDADALELLVHCTKGWKHVLVDGKELVFNETNARQLYTRFPWIRDQVSDFVQERANFLGESSNHSSPMLKEHSS